MSREPYGTPNTNPAPSTHNHTHTAAPHTTPRHRFPTPEQSSHANFMTCLLVPLTQLLFSVISSTSPFPSLLRSLFLPSALSSLSLHHPLFSLPVIPLSFLF